MILLIIIINACLKRKCAPTPIIWDIFLWDFGINIELINTCLVKYQLLNSDGILFQVLANTYLRTCKEYVTFLGDGANFFQHKS